MFRQQFLAAFAAAVFCCSAIAQDQVVYHFGGGLAQTTNGLRNIPEVSYTPFGVARIAQLQSREGYAYLKP